MDKDELIVQLQQKLQQQEDLLRKHEQIQQQQQTAISRLMASSSDNSSSDEKLIFYKKRFIRLKGPGNQARGLLAADPNGSLISVKKLPPIANKIDVKEAGAQGGQYIDFDTWMKAKKKAERRARKKKLGSMQSRTKISTAPAGRQGLRQSQSDVAMSRPSTSVDITQGGTVRVRVNKPIPSPLLLKLKSKQQSEELAQSKRVTLDKHTQQIQSEQRERERRAQLKAQASADTKVDASPNSEGPSVGKDQRQRRRKEKRTQLEVWTVEELLDKYRIQQLDFDTKV